MWGHPHVIPSPIQSRFTAQLSILSPYNNQHSDLVNSSLTTTANHSLTPSFSIYFHKRRKRPPASVLHPTSHAYQLCQPANGRADWTAGDRNKRSQFGPTRFIWQSTRALRTSPAPFWRLWQRQLPSVAHVTTHGLRYRPALRMR